MVADPVCFDDLLSAQRQIAPTAVRTPLLTSEVLDRVTGANVFVKAEPLQRTGSFKFRGAYNRISRLSDAERKRGVLAFSAGNHGQAVAESATLMGTRAIIVMPSDAPRVKILATRDSGGEVVLYDRSNERREVVAAKILAERGAILIHPFDDPLVIAGQGTAAVEVIEDLDALGLKADAVLAGASGGGLIAGTAIAFEARMPHAACFAVEPAMFDDYARSLVSGQRETNSRMAGGLCDALLSQTPGEITFPLTRTRLKGGLSVDDDDVFRAMAFAFRWLKLVIEPGGAVALAALLAGKIDVKGKTVVVIASGGNVDPDIFTRALEVGLPPPDAR